MFSAINVADVFVFAFLLGRGLPEFPHVHVLMTFKTVHPAVFLISIWALRLLRGASRASNIPIQQYPAQSLFKVLSESSNDLFKYVHACRALFTMSPLAGEVVVQNLIDRFCVRKGYELIVLGDVLPVIYQQGLDVVGHGEVDHGFAVIRILLSRWISIPSRSWSFSYEDRERGEQRGEQGCEVNNATLVQRTHGQSRRARLGGRMREGDVLVVTPLYAPRDEP